MVTKDGPNDQDEYDNDEFDDPEFLHELSAYTDSFDRPAELHDEDVGLVEDDFEAKNLNESEPCRVWALATVAGCC